MLQLGEILLLRAQRSIRPAVADGRNRRGSKLVKALFRCYAHNLGNEAVWETGERL